MWGTVGVAQGQYNLAGGLATSGAITNWLRELFGGTDFDVLLSGAAASGPGARGLLMLPYFAGERTPIMDPLACGGLLGLTLEHSRGDLYRAALEATAFGVRHNIATMRDAGVDIRRAVAVGGGTQGDLWPQVVADATGIPQAVPRVTIGASLGSAFLAAGLVCSPRIEEWNPIDRCLEPSPTNAAFYAERYGDYLEFYRATRGIAHRLTAQRRNYQPAKENE
jgi:xylulokinase